MRLIDFFVYYETTLYKSKEEENSLGNQRLNKALTIAAIIIAVWVSIIIQLLSYLFLRKNVININVLIIIFLVIALLTYIIFRYIYILKGRYQYIISDNYRSFNMSKFLGAFVMFLTLLFSIGLSIAIGFFLGDF